MMPVVDMSRRRFVIFAGRLGYHEDGSLEANAPNGLCGG